MAESNTSIQRGSCLCGDVKFQLNGDALNAVLCHCMNCRKASGSPFMVNGWFKKTQLAFDNPAPGALKTYEDASTDTGRSLVRKFCANCGSALFVESSLSPDFVVVTIGSLDKGMKGWKPSAECYAKDSLGIAPGAEGVTVTQGPYVHDG